MYDAPAGESFKQREAGKDAFRGMIDTAAIHKAISELAEEIAEEAMDLIYKALSEGTMTVSLDEAVPLVDEWRQGLIEAFGGWLIGGGAIMNRVGDRLKFG